MDSGKDKTSSQAGKTSSHVREMSEEKIVKPAAFNSGHEESDEERRLRNRSPQSARQAELEYNPLLDYNTKMKRKEYEWVWTRLSEVGDNFWVIAESRHYGFIHELEAELFPQDSGIEDLQLKAGQVILDVGRAMMRYPNEDISLDHIDLSDRFEEEPSILPTQWPMLEPKETIDNSAGYEQFNIQREEARKKYNEAFELRKEKDKRKATEERLASTAKALASHRETRVSEVFPFLGPVIENPQEPAMNAMAKEPRCLIASRDYHASCRKATVKRGPSSLKRSVIQRPEESALKMMVEEPHCAKAKAIPLLVKETPSDRSLERRTRLRLNKDIIAVGSDYQSSSEKNDEPDKLAEEIVATDNALLGKRVPLTDDLFSPEDRKYLEYVLDKRLANSALTWEENEKLGDIKMNCGGGGGYVADILDYEVRLAEGRRPLHGCPVYYMDLLGGPDISVLPQDRKKFMPLLFRDSSKQAYDDEVRQEEHRAFLLECSPWMKEKPKLDREQWKKNISAQRLRQTQPDIPVEDRKALGNTEMVANYRAHLKGFDNAEEWKIQKEKKALEDKILREKRKVDAKREKRASARAEKTGKTPTIDQQEQ